jgi:F420-dependent methylenetetrahydromethanopterin dehydrogenase
MRKEAAEYEFDKSVYAVAASDTLVIVQRALDNFIEAIGARENTDLPKNIERGLKILADYYHAFILEND